MLKVAQLGASQGTFRELPQRKDRRHQGWAWPTWLPPIPVRPWVPTAVLTPTLPFLLGLMPRGQGRIHLSGEDFFPRELSIHSPSPSSLPRDPLVTSLADNKD